MALVAKSRISPQLKTTVPIAVRRKLGVGPGSVVEWQVEGGCIVLRPVESDASEDSRHAGSKGKPADTAAATKTERPKRKR